MLIIKIIITAFIGILILNDPCILKAGKFKLSGNPQNDSSYNSLNGIYIGLEEMCWTDSIGKKHCYEDPASPKRKWYHLGYLKIKGDSVYLDQNPINIYKKDTSWSASDGAFYYYNGTIEKKDTILIFNFVELFCDYCGRRVIIKPGGTREFIKRTKQMKGKLKGENLFINGYLYTKSGEEKDLRSEHPAPKLR